MEKIYSKIRKKKLLHIVSKKYLKEKKRIDLIDATFPLQVARVNLKKNTIRPHSNKFKINKKKKNDQNECWIVLKGVLYVSLFDIDKSKIKNLILKRGSILITVGGGHSINKSSKNTEIVEIKLGPYNGKDTIYY
jgi:hypothetical protein